MIALLAFAYFLAGFFGLSIASDVSASITYVWAPAGIAFAAVRILGRRMLPGVFLGALAVNLAIGVATPIAALIIATGNMGEALAATAVFGRLVPSRRMPDPRWIAALIPAAAIGCAVGATVGAFALTATDVAQHYGHAWITWYVGDVLGLLIMGTALLYLFPPHRHYDAAE